MLMALSVLAVVAALWYMSAMSVDDPRHWPGGSKSAALA